MTRTLHAIIYSLAFLKLTVGFSQDTIQEKKMPDNFCISSEEYRLYQMINDFRKANKLSVIPISASLCYVAKLHVLDLAVNRPDTSYCSLSSWSDKGPWSSCCHSRMTPNPECILNKPEELTRYSGEGHELCFYGSFTATADSVVNFFSRLDQSRVLLLNEQKWSFFNWKGIGVAMHGNYASIWVGEILDSEKEPAICTGKNTFGDAGFIGAMKPSPVITTSTGRYYIIFGSFNRLEDATSAMELYRNQDFPGSKVLVKGETYRVSLVDFSTQEEAQKAKARLDKKYGDAWIAKF